MTYELRVENGQLVWRVPGRLAGVLGSAGPDEMRDADHGVQARFVRDSAGDVTGFLLNAGRVVDLWFERVR